MNSIRTTNLLLLIIALPVCIYVLQTLSFIFVPLVSSMLIALLFVPMMRRMRRRGLPKWVNVASAIGIILFIGTLVFFLLSISSQEILSSKDDFFEKAELKIRDSTAMLQENFGVELNVDENGFVDIKKELARYSAQPVLKLITNSVPQLLMTLFFVVLWLSESINFEKVMNTMILKRKHSSVKTFMRIEKDIVKFLQVKFLISLGTGVATGLLCYFFDVSFPIFWGFFAFAINFIQMIGSIIAVVLCSIFAFIEMESSGTLLAFVLGITGVQVLFGSILEPIYMGKSFSINIIVVLVMLLFWGFVWGVPGMIMSIPITVFVKIILEQFDRTKKIAMIMQ